MQASVKVRIKLLYLTAAWVPITGLVAYNECPSQALNCGLQKKMFNVVYMSPI
jgi:hypothetical protein